MFNECNKLKEIKISVIYGNSLIRLPLIKLFYQDNNLLNII